MVLKPPLVSIVTPSYNSGPFIEETIRSVLTQDYPHIEYVVMEGGSSVGTLDILERYNGRLRFESKPDRGTADAVNQGVGLSQGSIVAWLSADDTYLPGAVSAAVRALAENPHAGVVYGDGLWVDAAGGVIRRYPTRPFDRGLLGQECFICQPAAFIQRGVFEKAGGLDTSLSVCFDYELWMRIARLCPFVRIHECLATSRMHPDNKTLGQRRILYIEAFEVLRKHFGYIPPQWAYGYARCLTGKEDQFFGPSKPAVLGYLLSLPLGLWHNRRRPVRFAREWVSSMVLRRGVNVT